VLRSAGALGEVANRWTFYIGADGKILNIDKKVSPGTSGTDIVANLKTLKVPPRKN
jgi:peroxiredoxin Q/BCP